MVEVKACKLELLEATDMKAKPGEVRKYSFSFSPVKSQSEEKGDCLILAFDDFDSVLL
jgi:hypothetical protein